MHCVPPSSAGHLAETAQVPLGLAVFGREKGLRPGPRPPPGRWSGRPCRGCSCDRPPRPAARRNDRAMRPARTPGILLAQTARRRRCRRRPCRAPPCPPPAPRPSGIDEIRDSRRRGRARGRRNRRLRARPPGAARPGPPSGEIRRDRSRCPRACSCLPCQRPPKANRPISEPPRIRRAGFIRLLSRIVNTPAAIAR